MSNIVTEISKYIFIILIAFYALHMFVVFRLNDEADRRPFYVLQNVFMVFIHVLGYIILYLQRTEVRILYLYLFEELVLLLCIILMSFLYPASNRLITNNMCMLLSVSFIMLCRLSFDKCLKQFEIVTVSMIIMMVIPKFFYLLKQIPYIKWISATLSIVMLLVVLLLGKMVNGSKLSFSIAGITFQPSEFVKLLFVIFIAFSLAEDRSFFNIALTTALAAIQVVILVLSKDLGSALIYFVVYIMMLFIATGGVGYLIVGLLSGGAATYLGYKMFAHVRIRFLAWSDPFSYIESQGYQITQSLFAIGTGSYFGMGLGFGSPEKIPVVDADFMFSAISEEFGTLFGLCLILVSLGTFITFMLVALKSREMEYTLIGVGLAVIYIFQTFLTVGGVTKFIPMTGVTYPLVSYGGTSVLCTLMIFGMMQGISCTKVKMHE